MHTYRLHSPYKFRKEKHRMRKQQMGTTVDHKPYAEMKTYAQEVGDTFVGMDASTPLKNCIRPGKLARLRPRCLLQGSRNRRNPYHSRNLTPPKQPRTTKTSILQRGSPSACCPRGSRAAATSSLFGSQHSRR